jgi:glycosyltransferase involved in cell wall biosynthesis
VKFHFLGWCPQPLASDTRIKIVPWAPINDYMRILSSFSPHVGIVPLHKNTFNVSKSNLKFLEYTAVGAITIASDIRPYAVTITNGVDGILVKDNKPESWFNEMSKFIDNSALIKPMANAALSKVKERGLDIKDNYIFWANLIKKIYHNHKVGASSVK